MRHIVWVLSIAALLVSTNSHAKGVSKKQLRVAADIIAMADFVKVPRALVLATCWHEGWAYKSRGKNPTHMDGATLSHGICQVKLETAQYVDKVFKHKIKATAERLEDDKINAFYSAKFLKLLLKHYHGNWQLAADGYNRGIGSAKSEHTPYVQKFNKSVAFVSGKFLLNETCSVSYAQAHRENIPLSKTLRCE